MQCLRILLVILFVITSCLTVEVKNLTAVVGASISFPDPVTERGFLSFGPKLIASVSSSTFEIEENSYTNRLYWSDGLFNLTHLQKTDSGVYSIDSKKGTIFSRYYELKLYDPVPVPVVTSVNVSTDVCTVECSVNKTEQTTLSWFKREDSVNRTSSGVLPLTLHRGDYTSTPTLLYTCVAQNPVDRKTVEVDPTTLCELNKTQTLSNNSSDGIYYAKIIIPITLTVLVLVGFAIFLVKKKCSKGKTAQIQSQDSVQYTEINIRQRRVNQQCNAPDSSRDIDRSQLRTCYDTIQAHRITPVYTNCGRKSPELHM